MSHSSGLYYGTLEGGAFAGSGLSGHEEMTLANFSKALAKQPLKITDTDFWVPAEKKERIAQMYSQRPDGTIERERDSAQLLEKPIFWEHESNRAVRSRLWKLVMKFKDPWELHSIAEDRTERNNVIKEFHSVSQLLARQWDDWAATSFVDD